MTAKYEINTQCDHATFFRELPDAIEHRPFEVTGNAVKVYDNGKIINITVSEEELKTLGSLKLPMEHIVFEFPEHTQEEADKFIASYRNHTIRCGGG